MEFLNKDKFMLLDTADDTTCWKTGDIKVVLRDLAKVHSVYLNNQDWLNSKEWLERKVTSKIVGMMPLWRALLRHAHSEFPEFWSKERVQFMENGISNLQKIMTVVNSAPQTMTHNDCNPRNMCLRLPDIVPSNADEELSLTMSKRSKQTIPYPDVRMLCLYDWELATIDAPQHDVAEFLSFVLQPSTPLSVWVELLDFYREHLQFYSGFLYPVDTFINVFNSSIMDYAISRLLLYTMAHTYKDYFFLPRVVNSLFNYITAQVSAGGLADGFVMAKL